MASAPGAIKRALNLLSERLDLKNNRGEGDCAADKTWNHPCVLEHHLSVCPVFRGNYSGR